MAGPDPLKAQDDARTSPFEPHMTAEISEFQFEACQKSGSR
jgi:hypothetical protein